MSATEINKIIIVNSKNLINETKRTSNMHYLW